MSNLMMSPRSGGSMPRFPLLQPPRCNKCDRPCNRESRGRRFCYCCPCTGPQNKSWSTWDDAEGVQPGNPVCDCGFYCRVATNNTTGKSFERCAVGQCEMTAHKAQSPGRSPARSPRARGPSTGTYQASAVSMSASNGGSYTQVVSAQISTQRASIPVPASPPRSQPRARIDTEFVRLLSHVMEAMNRVEFPTKVIDLTGMLEGLSVTSSPGKRERSPDSPEPFRMSYSSDFERHSKIGAAGELLVSYQRSATPWDWTNLRLDVPVPLSV